MIRHGIIHESPGYVCPFCPDREHKYPRPDNLQRSVIRRLNVSMKGYANTFHEDMFASTIQRKTAMILSSEMSWHNGQKGVLVDDEDVLIHPHHLRPNNYRS
jgi:hypothetical protein